MHIQAFSNTGAAIRFQDLIDLHSRDETTIVKSKDDIYNFFWKGNAAANKLAESEFSFKDIHD